jgi:hypothetical protein
MNILSLNIIKKQFLTITLVLLLTPSYCLSNDGLPLSLIIDKIMREVITRGTVVRVKDINELNKEFPTATFDNKLIYIDTRDNSEFKESREYTYNLAKKLGDNIDNKGVVFLVKRNNVIESRSILNSLIKNHEYSYKNGPFILGYREIINKNKKLIRSKILLNLSGLSKKCISTYFQDIEQAIVRNRISEKERKKWKSNTFSCEIPSFFGEEYAETIEKVWKYIAWLVENDSKVQ